ncbi:hypothetical protein [Micromonospora sp. NPDC005806]|uniref:hypothetical protein n=1 Tax=Micromonospora sp. NPDC005806 TaxID=3364234 RepID=UPI0036B82C51
MREGAGEPPSRRGSFLLRHGAVDQATFVELFSDLAMVFILSRLVAQAFDV